MAQNRKDNYQDNEFVEKNEPFKNDLLGRKDIAQLWQDTLLKSGKHFVMAVDASWGMGKSYFARNWECKLLHDDYKVCYIDAFEYDFTDDPFMTITSNLIEAFEFTELEEVSNKLNTFFRAFKGHLGAAVPALVGGVIKIVSNIPQIGGIADIGSSLTNAASNAVKDAKNKSMNPADEVLQSDLSYNAAMTQFKDKLKELIKKQNSDKPFIVIVDELDRCKPTYAIEFLEKLKHLFDIPNIIFILFINEKELANAISHTYGVNGKDYLGKFIQVSANLSLKNSANDNIRDYFLKYTHASNEYIDIDNNNYFFEIISIFKTLQTIYPTLSLREIDNIVKCADIINIKGVFNLGLFYILKVIQLKDKKFYEALSEPIILNNQYDIVMPNLLKDIDNIEFKYGKIIGCFILLCYHIGTSSNPFQEYKHLSATTNNKNLEKLLQKHGYIFTGMTTYEEYLCQLVALADLNINNTGVIYEMQSNRKNI